MGPGSLVGEVLVQLRKPWILSPASHKSGMVTHCCNSNTIQEELEGSKVQSHPQIHTEFVVILSCIKPCFKTNNKTP